jgi:hypothetical protein
MKRKKKAPCVKVKCHSDILNQLKLITHTAFEYNNHKYWVKSSRLRLPATGGDSLARLTLALITFTA